MMLFTTVHADGGAPSLLVTIRSDDALHDWLGNICLAQSRHCRVPQAMENKARLLDAQLWQETLIAPTAQVSTVAAIGVVAVVGE